MKLNWRSQAQFLSVVDNAGERLALIVQPGGESWHVMSLVTSENVPDAILENHAHKMVGTYDTIVEAFQAAESFAQAWVRDFKATKHRRCECGDVRVLRD